MSPSEVNTRILNRMFGMFPANYDTREARVALLAIGLQESGFTSRRQLISKVIDGKKRLVPEGPAIGLWQFEQGNEKSRGGVWGVMNHFRVGPLAKQVCRELGIAFDAKTVWLAMETNDLLAACFARLLLLSDAQKLPKVGDQDGAWELYAKRTWRPGKPHPDTWPANYKAAVAATEA